MPRQELPEVLTEEFLKGCSLRQLFQLTAARLAALARSAGTVDMSSVGRGNARRKLEWAMYLVSLNFGAGIPTKNQKARKIFSYAAKEALTPCRKGTKQAALVDLLRKGGATREELQPAIGVRDAHYVLHMLAPHGYGLRADFEGGVERLVLVMPEGAQIPAHTERAGKKGPPVDPAQVDWVRGTVPGTAS